MLRLLTSLSVFLLAISLTTVSWAESKAKLATIEPVKVQKIKQKSKVLFLPLDASQAGVYAPLVPGLSTMLASELASRERIIAVDYDLKKKELSELASTGKVVTNKDLAVDYIIRGSAYKIGDGLSLQVKAMSMTSANNTQNFSVKAESEQEIFAAVDELAAELAKSVFGYDNTANIDGTAALGLAGFTTAHPEIEYKKGLMGGGGFFGSANLNAVADVKTVRRLPPMPIDVVGMFVDDIDGDGIIEQVYASKNKVVIYQNDGEVGRKVAEYELGYRNKINNINVADLDDDGKKEIYISANFGSRALSQIVSWQKGGGVKKLMDIPGLYIQPLKVPGKGWQLLGQRGSTDRAKSFVLPGVYHLELTDFKHITRGERLPLPAKVNIHSFLWADLTGNGTDELVYVDGRDRLLVYNSKNELIHVSRENYGGSTNHFGVGLGKTNKAINSDEQELNDYGDWTYIPTRLIAKDINNDGKMEIIIGANRRSDFVKGVTRSKKKDEDEEDGEDSISDGFFGLFPNLRGYEGGDVVCLQYEEAGIKELWRTSPVTGEIPSYGYYNSKKNGEKLANLLIAQIPNRSFFGFSVTGNETRVIHYKFTYKNSNI
ncbi:MAG: VCBS repeat-containing protein [Desulfotalea sp.]